MGLFSRRAKPPPPRPDDDEAPGWDAVTAALEALHGGPEVTHVGFGPSYPLGTDLHGASVYGSDPGHWHYVTYGLSELWSKDDDADPAVSGWGFELTWRVRRTSDVPPAWPFQVLNSIAVYVNEESSPFAPGHRMAFGGPVTGFPGARDGPDSALEAVALTLDPQLGRIETVNGSVAFLQVVGVTEAELERMKASSTAAVLAVLAEVDPLLVTDPARGTPTP